MYFDISQWNELNFWAIAHTILILLYENWYVIIYLKEQDCLPYPLKPLSLFCSTVSISQLKRHS